MVIKASAGTEIRTLVEALDGPDEVHREAAIARLAIIGGRAVERLIDAYGRTTDRHSRVAILRTLDAIGDHRSGPLAQRALPEGGDVSVAAVGVLRSLLDSSTSAAAGTALDTLVTVALDRSREHRVRLAALEALQDLPESVRARVADAVSQGDAAFRKVARTAGNEAARSEAVWD